MDGPTIVQASGLKKVFKDFWGRPKVNAVNTIDFSIKQGQVVGFLGPNGSGKSTTIKMLLGLLYPTKGWIKIFDHSPKHIATKQRIGYLPEETYLYPYLTARETLEFFASLFKLPKLIYKKRSQLLLEQIGLAHSADRPVGEFSKGMARRIGLAQALINDPDLVMLDEPTTGLDPIARREVKNVIRLLAIRKKTIILCSHLLTDIEDICDQTLIMYGGKIHAKGPLKDLLSLKNQTQITSSKLNSDILQKITTLLDQSLDSSSYSIHHPRMSLEDLFMQVVEKAKAKTRTASVDSGGKIAGFLAGVEDEEKPETFLKN